MDRPTDPHIELLCYVRNEAEQAFFDEWREEERAARAFRAKARRIEATTTADLGPRHPLIGLELDPEFFEVTPARTPAPLIMFATFNGSHLELMAA